jgi:hypothetical protein
MSQENKEIQGEVDLMNKSFDDLYGDNLTDPPATDSPAVTDAPTTDEPATEIPSTGAPATDEPKTEPPATDAPDDRDQIITDLRAKLAEKGSEPKPTKAPTTPTPLNLETQDFIGDEDVESLTGNKESLNKILNLVYSKGVTDSRNIIGDGVAKSLPPLVSNQIDVVTQMKEVRDNFYAANEDLRPFPNVVSAMFEEVAAKDPNQTYASIIEAIAPEARKRLNLPDQIIKSKDDKNKGKSNPPKLPRKKGKSGRTSDKPKTSPIESELDEMNEVLGR